MREIKLNYNFMFKFVFSYFTVIFVSLLKNLVKRKRVTNLIIKE